MRLLPQYRASWAAVGSGGAVLASLVLLGASLPEATVPGSASAPYIVVLGIAQDGGYPQAGCSRPHCDRGWKGEVRHVVSLGIVDPAGDRRWMIDATPDFRDQLRRLERLDGIFLTHAHIGHYTGLIHLGREVQGARGIPVHAMPRLGAFLTSNGPFSQLVRLGNITLRQLEADRAVALGERLKVVPFLVPHRDEFSETVGFRITGPRSSVVFIPDIDKWERWDRPIEEVIQGCDVAYLDGTFYDAGELPGRSMAEVPHPFIVESLARLAKLPAEERAKVRFIHLNHTNPAIFEDSEAARAITRAGCRVAREGERVDL